MNCELMFTYDTPAYMFNVYKNQLSRQTGSMNLMAGLDINVCPIPVKTDVGQVDLVLRLSDGTSEKIRFPNMPG